MAAENQSHKSTLLIIDDDPDMVRLISRYVENEFRDDFAIETETDPEMGLGRIEQGGIDIVLTDLEMPNVNGIELLRSAKKRNPSMQVLFLTGQSTLETLLEAIELGATDYLLKPVDRRLLLQLLSEANQRQLRWKQALASIWQRRRAQGFEAKAGGPA